MDVGIKRRIFNDCTGNGDFIVPCVMSVLFSMLAAAFLAMVKYGFSTADNFNDSKTGQVFILN